MLRRMRINRENMSKLVWTHSATAAKDCDMTQAWNLRRTHQHTFADVAAENMVPCGLEPQTSRLLAERSSQLSYETRWFDYIPLT